MDIRNEIIKCAQNNGIIVSSEGIVELDVISSLDFVSFFVEIENCFSIQIPDKYLNLETISNIDNIERIVRALIKEK